MERDSQDNVVSIDRRNVLQAAASVPVLTAIPASGDQAEFDGTRIQRVKFGDSIFTHHHDVLQPEGPAKFVFFETTRPENGNNPHPNDFSLVADQTQINPVSSTTAVSFDGGRKINNEVATGREQPTKSVFDGLLFRIEEPVIADSVELVLENNGQTVSIPVETPVAEFLAMPRSEFTVDTFETPEECSGSTIHTSLSVRNESSVEAVFRAGINVSGAYQTSLPVTAAVDAGSSRVIEIGVPVPDTSGDAKVTAITPSTERSSEVSL